MRDGRVRHTIYYKATFARADGEVAGLIGTIVDITERKQAEQREAIEHAVARFLGSSESLGDAIRGIMQVMCERLDWACAARWSLDEAENRLHCIETWSVDDPRMRGVPRRERARDLRSRQRRDDPPRAVHGKFGVGRRRHPQGRFPARRNGGRGRPARSLRVAGLRGRPGAGRDRVLQPRGAQSRQVAAADHRERRQPDRAAHGAAPGRGGDARERGALPPPRGPPSVG